MIGGKPIKKAKTDTQYIETANEAASPKKPISHWENIAPIIPKLNIMPTAPPVVSGTSFDRRAKTEGNVTERARPDASQRIKIA